MLRRLSARTEDEQAAADRQTASLAGLAAVLLLVVLALHLIRVLTATASIQDCLMAGRRDCDAVVTTHPYSP